MFSWLTKIGFGAVIIANWRLLLRILFIVFCSCGTQNNNLSKPSASLTISPAATTLLDVIVGKFPGIRVIGDNVANGNPKILIRGGSLSINNQAYAIFDIDGSLQTDFPSYIDP